MARLSLRQSIASQNLPGDGCASDSARNTGMEEEGKSTRNQTGKTNINVIPQLVDRRKASAFTRNVE